VFNLSNSENSKRGKLNGLPLPIFYITPDRETSETLGNAFTQGCGGELKKSRFIGPEPSAFYGVSKYTNVIYKAARDREQDYYYIDNGYFRPGHYNGYYRVTKNSPQHNGKGTADSSRWDALDIKMTPWKLHGDYVLIVCQSRTYFELRGMRGQHFLYDTIAEISKYTDKPIIVRPKPTIRTKSRPLEHDLKNAWCVVTYSSNVAVEAVIAGVPVFPLADCAASIMGLPSLSKIDNPIYPDRLQWAWNLAANQWTIKEIKSGKCWKDLQR